MYLRTTQRRNRDGVEVRYLQLAHNHWDSEAGRSRVHVLHNFGREDEVDRDAIRRLIRSLSRAVGTAQAVDDGALDLRFVGSRTLGSTWLLHGVWSQLGLDQTLRRLLANRGLDDSIERALLAMVSNVAMEPRTNLTCFEWTTEQVVVPGVEEISEDRRRQAMDLLLEIENQLCEEVCKSLTKFLDLEVDMLFLDTMWVHFETDQEGRATVGRKDRADSKDPRPELPRVLVGTAGTRDGIPIRVWTWPATVGEQDIFRQVKETMSVCNLTHLVRVADRDSNSAETRRWLHQAEESYIMTEKLRNGNKEAQSALSRQGRFHKVAEHLEVKEVVLYAGTMGAHFILGRDLAAAALDATERGRLVAQLEDAIAGSDKKPLADRQRLIGDLRSNPALSPFLNVTASGLLRIDRARVAEQERLDGKFLLRTNDRTLSAADAVRGYNQLLQIQRAWREVRTIIDLRPSSLRKVDAIRSHVVLCWLATVLIRTVEHRAGRSWRQIRREMDKLHLVEFLSSTGRLVHQRTEITAAQEEVFTTLGLEPPPLFYRGSRPKL